jgi:hypothetical protein
VVAVALLALAGWRTHWPAALFATKQVASSAALHGPPAHRRKPAASAPPATSTPSPSPSVTASPGSPAAIVEAYFAAIDAKNYATAWQLGGDNVGGSYSSFVNGFDTTASDTVTILSLSGNTVTARLTAEQTDGTVKTYQGTYTVDNGVLVKFDVQQIG